MANRHSYEVTVEWTGDDGEGTASYRSYRRDHVVSHGSRPPIAGSSDPAFRGSTHRWNPEQLLVASLAQCHMLWYLHLSADVGIVVHAYVDRPVGELELDSDGFGRFVGVVLRPHVTVRAEAMVEAAATLHSQAHEVCFIARSVAFPVTHEPTTAASS